jgi:hypothetical protein
LAGEGREEDRMDEGEREGEREVEREVKRYVCDCREGFPWAVATLVRYTSGEKFHKHVIS